MSRKGAIFMKNSILRFTICVFFFAFLLSSCASTSPEPISATATSAWITPIATGTPTNMLCTIVGGGTAAADALNASITENDHILGPADAPVTILVYSDFQCHTCALVENSLEQLYQAHPDTVRIVFRYFPLTKTNDKAGLAIQAAEAAGMQGKFWEMHNLLFEKQADWSGLDAAGFDAWAAEQAASLGLDAAQFRSDYSSDAVKQVVESAVAFASAASQPTIPLLFVNGTSPYTGPVDFNNLDPVVQLTALARRQFTTCPAWQINMLRQYIATLRTAKGDIVIELYADKAPLAVNSFVFLARSGWYNGVTFYRVTPVLAQTGDPSDTGLGNPGYLFSVESPSGLKFDRPGVVALMNDGLETNGGRFFITLAGAPQLDGQYTVIGQVLSGMDVLTALSARDPIPGQVLPSGDLLLQILIEEK
jgi:cyclophilin family peptidyl-prolyl cis-trans isomerase/protein-disulfide isomerase